MSPRRPRRWALALLLAVAACKTTPRAAAPQSFRVDDTRLTLPALPGWVRDTSLPPLAAAAGGPALRLVRESAVAGSPRIDVALEPVRPEAAVLEAFLTRSLQQMAALEAQGLLHIDTVDQARVSVGRHPAYRVHHEYTQGSGSAQVAINQVATLLVLDGRGVAVTAAGRTELYHPLAEAVQAVLDGLAVDAEPAAPAGVEADVTPIDLGRVGGKKKAP